MKKENFKINDSAGLHARPASDLTKAALSFKCNVNFIVGDKKANAKSVLGLMSLGLKKGTEVVLECDGEDEDKAIIELMNIIKSSL